ncbi:tripartite tricarboxylate transporter TctB family protein [Pelagibacterium sp.]|uniref:tripartite tricarboxylate transporter TctB family protein n=1 Tax=Pelagibacterium sp. TaxID=1967288 RepID=UPI003C7A34C5
MKRLMRYLFSEFFLIFFLLLIFNVAYLVDAWSSNKIFEYGVPSTSFLPIVLSVIMFAGLIGIAVEDWRGERLPGSNIKADQIISYLRSDVFLMIFSTIVYVLFFVPAGYVLSTLVYTYVILAIFRFSDLRSVVGQLKLVASASAIVAAIYLFFVVGFGVRLPGLGA